MISFITGEIFKNEYVKTTHPVFNLMFCIKYMVDSSLYN